MEINCPEGGTGCLPGTGQRKKISFESVISKDIFFVCVPPAILFKHKCSEVVGAVEVWFLYADRVPREVVLLRHVVAAFVEVCLD